MIDHMNRFGTDCWHLCYSADVKTRTVRLDQLYWETLHGIKLGKPAPELWSDDKPWTPNFILLCNDHNSWRKNLLDGVAQWRSAGRSGPQLTPDERVVRSILSWGEKQIQAQEVDFIEGEANSLGHDIKRQGRDKGAMDVSASGGSKGEPNTSNHRVPWFSQAWSSSTSHGPREQHGSAGWQNTSGKCLFWNKNFGPCKGLSAGTPCKAPQSETHVSWVCQATDHPASSCPNREPNKDKVNGKGKGKSGKSENQSPLR